MGKSSDSFELSERERAALRAALDSGRRLPRDWIAMAPGSALRRLRKELGMRQDQLSPLLGMRQSTVSKIERGRDTHLSTLRRLFQALGWPGRSSSRS